MSKVFEGFTAPQENWSKLPHAIIDELPRFVGKAELAVVLYILRHTWGFQEFEDGKRITLDEFQNGRKRSDGGRMDNGIGMTRPSIIEGLAQAAEHGFIEVEVDDHDKGRVKKSYRLHMQGLNNFTPEVKKVDSKGKRTLPRTEKETIERKHRKNGASAPRERNPLFDAFLEACYGERADSDAGRAIATEDGALIGKFAAKVGKVGRTPQDVRREALAWSAWSGSRPTVAQLAQKVMQAPPGSNGAPMEKPQTDEQTRRMAEELREKGYVK